jgi:hypothetical protein
VSKQAFFRETLEKLLEYTRNWGMLLVRYQESGDRRQETGDRKVTGGSAAGEKSTKTRSVFICLLSPVS